MNGPANNDNDRMNDAQLEILRGGQKNLTDASLLHSYHLYLDALHIGSDGVAPSAAKIQYFVETW